MKVYRLGFPILKMVHNYGGHSYLVGGLDPIYRFLMGIFFKTIENLYGKMIGKSFHAICWTFTCKEFDIHPRKFKSSPLEKD